MRIARDLHDLLGHSLTAASVKAQLAGRLVGRDDTRAAAEIGEVERLTRQVLADVRAAVAGYREVSLAVELATAREVLGAAGIAADLPGAVDEVPAGRRELFGWVVREGVDQRGPALAGVPGARSGSRRRRSRSSTTGAAGSARAPGSGLAGLAERAAAAGGQLEAGPMPGGGYRLALTVPARAPAAPTAPGSAPAPRPSLRSDTAETPGWTARRRVGSHRPGAGRRGAAGDVVIRVLLADDQSLVRGALAALLSLEPDLEVVAEVGRGDEVVAAARESKPDVALLDVEMPGLDGIAAAAALRAEVPAVRVAILTTFGRPGYLRRAMEAGALGFVVKDAPADELAEAVRRVAAGLRVVDPTLAAATLAGGSSPLTARERDVLIAARDGATVADIAARLFLSEGTVRNYLSAAITKTNTRNRVEALRTAEANGWL